MRRTATTLLVVLTALLALGATTASAGVSPTGVKTVAGTGGAKFGYGTCTGSSLPSTWTNPGAPPYIFSTDVNPTFTSCRVTTAPTLALTVACTSTSQLTATGRTVSTATPITLSIDCTQTMVLVPSCRVRISGSVVGSFNNTTSTLTIATIGQALMASGSTCAGLPNGAVSYTDTASGAPSYSVSPATTITY